MFRLATLSINSFIGVPRRRRDSRRLRGMVGGQLWGGTRVQFRGAVLGGSWPLHCGRRFRCFVWLTIWRIETKRLPLRSSAWTSVITRSSAPSSSRKASRSSDRLLGTRGCIGQFVRRFVQLIKLPILGQGLIDGGWNQARFVAHLLRSWAAGPRGMSHWNPRPAQDCPTRLGFRRRGEGIAG